MAQVITVRRLVTELVLRSKPAERALEAYDKLWKNVAKGAQDAARQVNAAAASMADTVDRMATAARSAGRGLGRAPSTGGGGGGGGGGSRRDPLDAIMRDARKAEREEQRRIAQEERVAAKRAQAATKQSRRHETSEARQAGLAAGAAKVNEAARALGTFATASDRAKAKVADLSAQVERNRKEMVALREQSLKTGDADGTLAARMQGLSVATAKASAELREARQELRKVDGGLIDAVKNVANLEGKFGALRVAAGNLISGGVQRLGGALVDGLQGAAGAAIKFESGMADVAKVVDGLKTPTGEVTAEYTAMEAKILDLSKTIAGPGAEGFAKIYAAAGEAGIAKQDLDQFAESAAKMSVAFGISADEAGAGMAKMRSGLGLTQDEVESLAGTMNYLSNNMAVNARQAMEVVLTTGGVGKAANVSGQEVAGLGAAMIAAGAQSDVAATASKNYILALSSGATATKAQRAAFQALGMDAEEVARQFTGSAEQRLRVQQDLLSKIGKMSEDRRVSVLSQLFGKESLGAISGITGNVERFTRAMQMATDTTAAASSVQNEYNVRSKTTENAVALLKANIEALAIKFGQALLPYINKVVEFLTSPEGQDWGAKAVEKAIEVVTGLATALGSVGSAISTVVDLFGGAGTAVLAFGALVAGLAGPWGIAAAAASAALGAMILGIGKVLSQLPLVSNAVSSILGDTAAAVARIQGAEMAAKVRSEEDAAMEARATSPSGPTMGYGPAPMASGPKPPGGAAAGSKATGVERFAELVAARKHGQLKPSEAAELRKLSKSLDMPIPPKGGGHKASKMDKQLAAMDPSVRALVTRGGEADAGGHRKVHDDVLSKGAFAAASKANGMGGVGGVGSVGPGPSITNVDNRVIVTVQQAIDARSTGSVPNNIREAASDVGQRTGDAVVKFVGASRVKALQNSGGRLVGA